MTWLDTLEEIRKTDWSSASAVERNDKSKEVVDICAYAGALTAIVPVPVADLALLLPVHSAMVMTLGHVHGRKLEETEAKRVVLELGAVAGLAFAGHAAISALKRLVLPAVGGLLSIPATFALTWAVGRAAIAYFEDPHLSRDDLRQVFKDAVEEGKQAFSKEAFDRFRKQASGEDAPAEDSSGDDASAAQPEDAQPPPPPKPKAPVDESLKHKKRTL